MPLSNLNYDIQRYLEIARAIPDVRESKVDRIREQILLGEYSVSTEATAEQIVRVADTL